MRLIPLAALPNQTFTATLEGYRFEITLKAGRACLVCDIAVDGVQRVAGSHVLAGEMLIPYRYLEAGNFILTTVDDVLPSWGQLGVTQQLYYLTAAELEAMRG